MEREVRGLVERVALGAGLHQWQGAGEVAEGGAGRRRLRSSRADAAHEGRRAEVAGEIAVGQVGPGRPHNARGNGDGVEGGTVVSVVEQATGARSEGPCAGEVDGVVVEHESIAAGPSSSAASGSAARSRDTWVCSAF